jgi:hypothetical protein
VTDDIPALRLCAADLQLILRGDYVHKAASDGRSVTVAMPSGQIPTGFGSRVVILALGQWRMLAAGLTGIVRDEDDQPIELTGEATR